MKHYTTWWCAIWTRIQPCNCEGSAVRAGDARIP